MTLINCDVFLLITRNNEFTKQAINCLNKSIHEKKINLYISTTEEIINQLSYLINKDKVKILLNKKRFNSLWDHMIFLTDFSKAKYISFIHDDDIFDSEFLIKSFEILCKYHPAALSNKGQIIDKYSRNATRRNYKPLNKIIRLSKNRILSKYFLPFERPTVFPSIIFNRQILNSYWKKYYLRNLSIFEDVRLTYYFASKGNFLENLNSSLYSWRISDLNMSNQRNQIDRFRLISWMKNLDINQYFKFILLLGAKIQHHLLFNNFDNNPKLKKIMFSLRRRIVKYRSGI